MQHLEFVVQSSSADAEYNEAVSYLLKKLTEEEAERFEENYLSDHDAFEHLEAIEEELIEDYLRDQLPGEIRELFETQYANRPENREKIDFAKRLIICSDSLPARQAPIHASPTLGPARSRGFPFYSMTPARAASIAIIVLLISVILLGGYLFRRNRLAAETQARIELEERERELQKHLESQQGSNKNQDDKNQPHPQEPRSVQQPAPPTLIASLRLKPNTERGASGGKAVSLTSSTAWLKISLVVSRPDYDSYNVTVRRPSDSRFNFSKAGLKPVHGRDGLVITVNLPAQTLEAGLYVIDLEGARATGEREIAHTYQFTLQK